jgi:hypothetical protein
MLSGLPIAVLELVESSIILEGLAGQKECPSWLADPKQRFVLICQIYEHEQVVAEALPQMEQMEGMLGSGFPHTALGEQLSALLLDAIVEMPGPYVEIDCAPSVMSSLWLDLPAVSSLEKIRMRPGAGRMRLSCDEAWFEQLHSQLKTWCQRHHESFTIALVNGDRFRAIQLPHENASVSAVTKKIKEQFDPAGCLNPFACLYQAG